MNSQEMSFPNNDGMTSVHSLEEGAIPILPQHLQVTSIEDPNKLKDD